MAIAYRSAADGQANGVTTHTCSIPAGVVAGDLLIMAIHLYMNATPINTPSGWTKAYDHGITTGGAAQRNMAIYTRVADGTEGATLSMTSSASAYSQVSIVAYSGSSGVDATADGAVPFNTSPGVVGIPSVTTTVANDVVVGVVITLPGSSSDAMTAPSGWTLRHTSPFQSTLNGQNYFVDEAQPAAGASGTAVGSISTVGTVFLCTFAVAAKGAAAAVTPVADFTGTPTSGTASLSVTFTDSSTNTPTSWAWTFGDGGTSSSQNPSHSYTTSGVYTVVLVATNSAGSDTKTRTSYITVGEAIVYASGGGLDIW